MCERICTLPIDRRIRAFDKQIDAIVKGSEACQRIAKISGVGPKTATAMIAAIGNGSDFKNGRHLAAGLGLAPRQHSGGGRRIMMGITKRGSQHFTNAAGSWRAWSLEQQTANGCAQQFGKCTSAGRGDNRTTACTGNAPSEATCPRPRCPRSRMINQAALASLINGHCEYS
jgi:transposase